MEKKYSDAEILGHSESTLTHKTCPNFDVQKNGVRVGIYLD